MHASRSFWIPIVLAATATAGCGGLKDAYGKEFVLYDSRRDASAKDPAEPATATAPAEPPAPTAAAANDTEAFARIVQLEHVRGEIERAILDGHDGHGTLARKRRAIDGELANLTARLGDRLEGLRRARIAELEDFAVAETPPPVK